MADIHSSSAVQEAVFDMLATVTGVPDIQSTPDLEIRALGLLDSMGVISLILALSEKLSVEIVPAELEEADIATPRSLLALVERKLTR